MAQFTVRNLEDAVRDKLRERAKREGRSMEETVREILRAAVVRSEAVPPALGTAISRDFEGAGFEGPIPELRGQSVEPPTFGQ